MGAVAPGCLRRLGLRGPLPSSMKHPWSDPCDFRAERVVRITEWGPRHLGGSGACGLWVFQVVRCTQSPGWRGSGPGRWVRADLVTICSEGFRDFSYLEGDLSCSISKGLRCPFAQAWGVGLPYRSSNALHFDLSLAANRMQSRAIRANLIQLS